MTILPDNHSDAGSHTQAELDSLRQLANNILLLLVILSGTFTMYLFYQYKLVHREVEFVRPQYVEAVAQFEQMRPKLEDFEKRITAFCSAHQDFAQLIAKYAPRRPVAAVAGSKSGK